jgi:hypothetical protein
MPMLVALVLAHSAMPANAAESVYTDVDTDHCKTLSEADPDEGGDFISLRCKGYKSYPLYFREGDLRQSVYFGHLSQEIIDSANETFGPFNHIGKKVEWRLDAKGRPFAAILRFHIENGNPDTGMPDKAHEGQVLVVSRVGQPEDETGCVVAYVDALANPKPNEMAREIADREAAQFVCGRDRARYHGIKGEKAGEPAYVFPGAD